MQSPAQKAQQLAAEAAEVREVEIREIAQTWSPGNPRLATFCADMIRLVGDYTRRGDSSTVDLVAVAEALAVLHLAIETIKKNTGVANNG